MSASPISRFATPEISSIPPDIKERLLSVQEKAGFIPNVFWLMARRPEEFRAFFSYHDAIMEKEGNLSKAEREMIVVATSALNQCLYCVAAHGAILRVRSKNTLIADQVAVNYRKAMESRGRGTSRLITGFLFTASICPAHTGGAARRTRFLKKWPSPCGDGPSQGRKSRRPVCQRIRNRAAPRNHGAKLRKTALCVHQAVGRDLTITK